METKNKLTPYKVIHPSEILKEELQARGIKQKDFAAAIGIQPSNFNAIINGKKNITKSIAEKIAENLGGITADFWIKVQKAYNESIKQEIKPIIQKEEESKEIAILRHFATIENELSILRRLLSAH